MRSASTFATGAAALGISFMALAFGCSNDDAAPDATPSPEAGTDGGSSGGTSGGTSGGNPQDGASPDGATAPPGPRYVGRVDTRDEFPRIAWGGSRVIVRFEGTGLSLKVREENLDRGPSGYDVIIDGKPRAEVFTPKEGEGTYELVKDLAAGAHVVELWRRTESWVGVTEFRGIDAIGGKLLAPPDAPKRRIEFLGDSDANGYGVDCASYDIPFSGATQDEAKSYPALIAKALDAEHHNLAMSGKGVSRNIGLDDLELVGDLYPRILAGDADGKWNFASWVPDVVFLAIGPSDWEYDTEGDRPPPDHALFKQKYHELVTLVRAKNPSAHILVTVAAPHKDEYPDGWNAYTNVKTILGQIVDERHAAPTNDAKVYFYDQPRASSSEANGGPDLTGCGNHANPAFHQKVATDAVAKIKSITGW